MNGTPIMTPEYISRQMLRVAPFPIIDMLTGNSGNGQYKVKLTSEKGQTNFLNITPEQFRAIEKILWYGPEGQNT
jgi:hypothetical protein